MKLISLEMSAFGPFKDKEFIDFTKYDTDKIFLISGKTGSGKTTIFDAISYALFGKMTGEYRNDSAIRSHYASREVDTYVKLVFDKDNKRYEIYRKPAYHVEGRKSKVTGEAVLSLISPSKSVLGEKSNIINPLIEDIIGFKYAQFKQIVVLPQGEFIKILNSKSNEKEVLLSSILDTTIYSLLTDKVKEDFNDLEEKIGKVKKQLEIILEENKVTNEIELKELKEKKEKESNDFFKIINSLNDKIKNLDDRIKKHKENNKNLDILKELNAKKDDLINSNKDVNEKKALLKVLKVLSSVKGYNENVNQSENQLKEECVKIEQLTNEFELSKIEHDKLNEYKKQLELMNKNLDSLKEKANLFKTLQESKNKLNSNLISIDGLVKETDGISKSIEDILKEKGQLEEEKNKNNVELESKNKFVNSYDLEGYLKVKDLYSKYESRKTVIEKINVYEIGLNNIEETLKRENGELEQLENKLKEWKNIHKNNILQNYISDLEEGKECPLCGSTHHPNILKRIEDFISDNQIEDLEELIKNKRDVINKENSNKSICESKIEDYKKDELYLLDVSLEDQIKKQYDEVSKNYVMFSEYKSNIISLKENIDSLDKDIKLKEESISTLRSEKLSKETNIALLKKDNEEIQIKLDKELMGNELNVLIEKNDSEIALLNAKVLEQNTKISNIELNYQGLSQKLNSSLEKKKELEDNIKINKEKIKMSLENSNLNEDSIEEYKDKLSELEDLEKAVSNYEIELVKLEEGIKNYSSLITGDKYVDCGELENELNDLKTQYEEENAKYLEIYASFEITKNDYDRYVKQSSSIADSIERYQMIAKLSKLCNGTLSGSKKISLQKFVLMKLLDEILTYANKYLLNFSSSRYSLVREENEALSDKGLDLSVFDEHTGYTRPVSSLSGGESFMSALALALGMSECIMNMHGGIRMDNIFVDEGFGSLDGESLNNAIETLMQLAANGRMIGIISHIDSIKQMIPQSIEIVKTKRGSTIYTN